MNYKRFFSRTGIFFMLLVVLNTTPLARASDHLRAAQGRYL